MFACHICIESYKHILQSVASMDQRSSRTNF